MISTTIKKLNPLKRLGNRSFNKDAKIFPICEYVLNFDGSSKGNPGLAGAGMVIYKNSEEYWASYKFVGFKTNNQSEYSALILGLKEALHQGIDTLCVYGDSLLVINQVNGIFRVKSPMLIELYQEVIELKAQFKHIEFNHVYRDYNKRADELSNLAVANINYQEHIGIESGNKNEEIGIKDMDEDWIEEIKLEDQKLGYKKKLSVKIPSAKNTKIRQMFKINPLFSNL